MTEMEMCEFSGKEGLELGAIGMRPSQMDPREGEREDAVRG